MPDVLAMLRVFKRIDTAGDKPVGLLDRIRDAIYGRFIEDPFFGRLLYGRERTYDIDPITRGFRPAGWINVWEGRVTFAPLNMNVPISVRMKGDGGPEEFHRAAYNQLESKWHSLELPIAEKLLPLCREWCNGLFDDYVLDVASAHMFYTEVVEMEFISIGDEHAPELAWDCYLSFMPRKGDLGGHNFFASLRRGRLLHVSVEG